MSKWWDPLGLSRIADSVFAAAGQVLVGQTVELPVAGGVSGLIGAVHELSPFDDPGKAILSGQAGLWRRVDVTFDDVVAGGRPIAIVHMTASDVRILEAVPQRLGAQLVEVEIGLTADQVVAWAESVAPQTPVTVVNGELLAPLPGIGRWGDAVLEPWVDGRSAGVSVTQARLRGRLVSVPERFHRRYERELDWLPEGATLTSVSHDAEGTLALTAQVEQFSAPVDIPKLLADMATRTSTIAVQLMADGLG
jgi:hypothetical protein